MLDSPEDPDDDSWLLAELAWELCEDDPGEDDPGDGDGEDCPEDELDCVLLLLSSDELELEDDELLDDELGC